MDVDMNDRWNTAVKEATEVGRATSGLSQGVRHQEIIRKQLIAKLQAVSIPILNAGTRNHAAFSSEIDALLDAVVQNASKDGLDLDGELIDLLTQVSGSMYAIEVQWQQILAFITNSES